jgi:hypothetical protein
LREGRVADQGPARYPRHNCSSRKGNGDKEKKECGKTAAERRQKRGKPTEDPRPERGLFSFRFSLILDEGWI